MNYLENICLALLLPVLLSSCQQFPEDNFSVEQPQSIASLGKVNQYAALKSYLPAETGFKLGAAVSISDFNTRGVFYRMINANFNEITLGYEMKHGAIVGNDGKLQLDNLSTLLKNAQSVGMSVYGHTLTWHGNQNARYLNGLLVTGVELDVNDTRENLINGSFEVNQEGWDSWYWGGASTREVVSPGLVGEKCLKFTHSSSGMPWDAQIAVNFLKSPVPIGSYTLSFFVKSDKPGKFRCSTVDNLKSADIFYQHDVSTTASWKYVEWDIESTGSLQALRFDLGSAPGTYYLDEVRMNPKSSKYRKPVIKELTASQKAAVIASAMEDWIGQMVGFCKDYVRAWDVVNEPMDDSRPNELKTAQGRDEIGDDEFFWQDYLGKDYAVKAFSLARKNGNPDDKLFINDYGLEFNLEKCKGLIDYVKYIESKGAKVDGIGTQMHMSLDVSRDNIDQMFKLLAATGKLIKISEIDIGIAPGVKVETTTTEQYQAQADLYQYTIGKYLEIVPAKQRYGVTAWSPLDSPDQSSWRAGEPVGLWNRQYARKKSFAGFANGLAGKDISLDLK